MKIQELIDLLNGYGIDRDRYPNDNPFQCVDLAQIFNRLYKAQLLTGNAVDIWNTYGERMYIPDFAPIRDSVSRVGSAEQKAALADAIDVGDVFANVGHYIKAAGQPWGVGQSELSHLLWWRNAGYFDADDVVDGKLVYHGKTFDYKKANGVA